MADIERAAFTDPWSQRAFEELLDRPHVRALALDDDQGCPVAYAVASVVADEGEILNFAVAPGSRERGLGHRLLEAVLDMFRREAVTAVYLEVRESNRAAIRLYERAGFRSLGRRRGYYRSPAENALTMVLDLTTDDARKR